MADITENEVRQFIAENLQDASDIPALRHRAVENKIMDYVSQEIGKVVKSKELYIESFTVDRNYSISSGLPANSIISCVIAMLVCKNANNGFAAGETVTAPTPYPTDSGRTAAQGIGVQFNNLSIDSVKVMVNDQITIMTAYNSTSGASANNVIIGGAGTADWNIKLIVLYK